MSIFAVKKTVFNTLHADILYESLTALEAEIFCFVIMHVKDPVCVSGIRGSGWAGVGIRIGLWTDVRNGVTCPLSMVR